MNSIAYVGMDVHQDEIRIAAVESGSGELLREERIRNREDAVRKLMRRMGARHELRCCYEAGGCGYVVYHWLNGMGIQCAVIAPSLVPRRPGERVKTDRRDAVKLALLHRAGELTEVRVPSRDQEAGRSLVRLREALMREAVASKHYVLKFLQVRGLVYRDGRNWTERHWRYLRGLRFEGAEAAAYGEYVGLLEFKLARLGEVERQIEQMSMQEPYRDRVGRLRCYRGIDTLTAMVMVSEVWDFNRFAGAGHFMSYLGLVPQEHSSGSTRRQGSITKMGNTYCRRVLVQSAWHYPYRPGVSVCIRRRRQGRPVETIARSWKAQYRLHHTFWRLASRKDRRIAAVAVARELAGFIWAEMVAEPGASARSEEAAA
jgi:transposase